MSTLALIIAIIALVVAVVAFMRTGGIEELRRQAMEAREHAANALGRIEESMRPEHHSDEPVRREPVQGEREPTSD